jgi:hypothetical protein
LELDIERRDNDL